MTYDNIHGLVEIDDHAIVVDDWDGGYGTFGEHVDDIKDGGVEGCSGDRPVGGACVGCLWWDVFGDISADLEFSQGEMELLYFSSALGEKGQERLTVRDDGLH